MGLGLAVSNREPYTVNGYMKTKIKQYINWPRFLAFIALFLLIGLSMTHPLSAQEALAPQGPAVTQGYSSDEFLQRGMIVRLSAKEQGKIETVEIKDAEKMHGIVVDPNDAPVTLSSDGSKVFVATSGRYEVLVSNQNGPIKPGDYVTISAIRGIGMKAGDEDKMAIGRAITAFDGAAGVVSSTSVKKGSEDIPVKIGRIEVDIAVGRNPLMKIPEPNLPTALQKATQSIAGHEISAARTYTAVLIFVLTTISAATLMYSGIRSGVISLGRNPLSRKTITRGIIQVVVSGLIIFISGIFGVYLLLKL